MSSPKILTLCGSTRGGSINQKLADTIAAELALADCDVTTVSLTDYELPIYNGDLEADHGVPENAKKLARLFHEHDGILVVSPEYNGSLTPLLKNTIDWVSRVSEDDLGKITPYRGRVAAIAACSPGVMGGISTLYHLREILVRLGMLVISEQLAVGGGSDAFDENGRLAQDRTRSFMEAMVKSFVEKTSLLPSVKS